MIFSVIVPFLNEEKYIERSIRALSGQDFGKDKYELIFVDNNSEDASAGIAAGFSEVKLLHEDERCAYTARNRALESAKGEIIAFTDGDCAVSKDWLSEIYKAMKESGPSIVLGPCSFPDRKSPALKMFEDYENAKIEYALSKCPKEYFFGYTRNMAVRAELFGKMGRFIISPVLGDLEFIQRCVSREPGVRVSYLPGMKIQHMEITTLRAWLEKIYTYGVHSRHATMKNYKPLGYRQKLDIYFYCCGKNKYSFPKAAFFLFLLFIGDICYKAGRIKGFVESKKSKAQVNA